MGGYHSQESDLGLKGAPRQRWPFQAASANSGHGVARTAAARREAETINLPPLCPAEEPLMDLRRRIRAGMDHAEGYFGWHRRERKSHSHGASTEALNLSPGGFLRTSKVAKKWPSRFSSDFS